MKTQTPFFDSPWAVVALALLIAAPAAAQVVVIGGLNRDTYNGASASDGHGSQDVPYNVETNLTTGDFFQTNHAAATVASASADGTAIHNSTILASDSSLQVTGRLSAATTASAGHDDYGYGIASAGPGADLAVYFSVSEPCSFTLSATSTNHGQGTDGPVTHGSFVAINDSTYGTLYGEFGEYPGFGYYYGPASGSTNGVLPPGNYVLTSGVIDEGSWNGSPQYTYGDFTYSGVRTISFTFNATALSALPFQILDLTPTNSAQCLLRWIAPVAGSYPGLTAASRGQRRVCFQHFRFQRFSFYPMLPAGPDHCRKVRQDTRTGRPTSARYHLCQAPSRY